LAAALGDYGYKNIKVRGAVGGMLAPDLRVQASLRPQDGKLIITGDGVKPNSQGYDELFRTFTPK
jgi:hypothetical protein